jgi:uncharacterized protein (DUF433 family)
MERITYEAGKCGGRACIRGMRIRVSDVLDMLAVGVSADEILKETLIKSENCVCYSPCG